MSLAWVGLVQALPIMLLALPAGQLADRLDRRRIVLFGLIVMSLASLGLAIVSHQRGSVEWMYAMLFFGACGRAFFWPASQALLPQLVPANTFGSAVTWRSTAYQIACVTGPALGGFMIGLQKTHHVGVCRGCGYGFGELLLRGGDHSPSSGAANRNRFAQNLVGRISVRDQ